jgi:AcrR family transcriptional regulator
VSKNPSQKGRRRRRPGELDDLILDAARELFVAKGYGGTSSREIAEVAGVYEPSIYRRFGSKAGLFEAAVFGPFNAVISGYLEKWQGQIEEPSSTEELVRGFIEPFYRLAIEQRELILALVSAQEFHTDTLGPSHGGGELSALLKRMETQAEVEKLRRPLRSTVDPSLTVRVAAGLVLGMAVFDQWVLPAGSAPPATDDIVDEMVQIVTWGVEWVAAREGVADPQPRREPSPELGQVLDRLADAERRAVRAELKLERLMNDDLATDEEAPKGEPDIGDRPVRPRRRRASA